LFLSNQAFDRRRPSSDTPENCRMSMFMTLRRLADLADAERAELTTLSRAVYPPEVAESWLGRHMEWSAHEWCVLVRTTEGALVSYAGIVLRWARREGMSVRVGGIGGVKTHPSARRLGFATAAMRRAVEFFGEQPDVAFGLLVCEPHLIGYYGSLGWQEFTGRLLVTQHGEPAEFTLNGVMTYSVREVAPLSGTIDLLGPPW
jgi:hypothetical protein